MATPYPPPHHMLSDLGLQIDRRHGELRVRLPVQPGVLDARGALRAGVLGVAFDVFAGNLAVEAARPDWALTSELSLHRLQPIGSGELVVVGQALRAGRSQLVIETRALAVADDATLAPSDASPFTGCSALGHIGFTRVARREDTPESPSDPPDVYRFGAAGASLEAPLPEVIGVVVRDAAAGCLELPLTPYVRNSVGGLQGGAIVSLVDAAATSAADALLGAKSAVEDLTTRFLALGRVGPIRSSATALRRDDDAALLRVELRDGGQEDRLVAVATALAKAWRPTKTRFSTAG